MTHSDRVFMRCLACGNAEVQSRLPNDSPFLRVLEQNGCEICDPDNVDPVVVFRDARGYAILSPIQDVVI